MNVLIRKYWCDGSNKLGTDGQIDWMLTRLMWRSRWLFLTRCLWGNHFTGPEAYYCHQCGKKLK